MVFISPWILWALFGALLPILIHLVNRWRHKSIPWAAMDFILKVTRERRGRKKLLHYLILALRALAVAVVVMAMARPLLSSFMGWGGSGIQEVILLLDRSPSMGAKPDHTTSLQEMVPPLVSDTMDKLGSPRLVLIDSATLSPLHLPSPDALPDLSATKTTDAPADIPSLLDKAAKYIDESGSTKNEIWIVSDMQAADWQPDSPRWKSVRTDLLSLPSTPAIRLLTLNARPIGNRSITIEKAVAENGELMLDFTITRDGQSNAAEETIPVTFSINNSPIVQEITLSGEKNRLIRKLPLPRNKAEGFGYISIPHDDQPRDDQYFFVFSPPNPLSVLVVSQDKADTVLLENMAAPPTMEGRKSTHARPQLLPDLFNFSLIIWQGNLPQGENATTMERFIENGGVVLFLPDKELKANSPEFLDVSWSAPRIAPEDDFFNITTWNHHTGPLRDSANNHTIPAGSVQAIRYFALAGKTDTVAMWNDGTPAVAGKAHGRGYACFLTSLPDYTWSNLAEGHMLLPLLQRLGEQGNARTAALSSMTVNSPEIPASGDGITRRLDNFDSSVFSQMPDAPQTTAGVYSTGSRVFCVNRAAGEDDPEQLSPEFAAKLLPDIQVSNFSTDGTGELVQEVWKLMLVIALLFLLLEALLCLPSPVKKKNPLI